MCSCCSKGSSLVSSILDTYTYLRVQGMHARDQNFLDFGKKDVCVYLQRRYLLRSVHAPFMF